MTGRRPAARPWDALPADLAALLRPELPALAAAVVAEIQEGVPEFGRPLHGQFGAGLHLGVEQGLRQFVDQIADPRAPQEQGAKVYRGLGRGEHREGRSLDALQAAYRIGARTAWRRFARLGEEADVPPATMHVLAEAVFAYVEEIAAHSVEGYADAQARAAGTDQQRRRRLLGLLVGEEPAASRETVVTLAREARWRLPSSVAVVAVGPGRQDDHRLPPSLGPEVLMDLDRPDARLLVPDADGPGRLETVRHALRGRPAAIGPSVTLSEAPVSLRLARRALALAGRGVLDGDELIECERHLATLALLADEDVIRLLAAQRLAPLTALRPSLRGRLTETLRCWLESRTGAPEIAARLKIHPQTVRYRMHQVEDLFGDRLQDPDWRVEMELALRAQLLLSAEYSPDPSPGTGAAGVPPHAAGGPSGLRSAHGPAAPGTGRRARAGG